MEKCAAFYEEVLGLQKVYDDEMEGKFLDTVQGRDDMHYRIVKYVSPEGFMIELLQDFNHEVKPQKNNCLQNAA